LSEEGWHIVTNLKKVQNNKLPLVSVVMPVYNAGRFLSTAIKSILRQTYANFELVIVDDQSKDNSWAIIQKFAKANPGKIRAVRLAKNTNAAGNGAVNAVYKKLKGVYVARMDADDIAHPTRIEKQVTYMEAHPEVILTGTQGVIINASGKVMGDKKFPVNHSDIYSQYFVFHPILHPSVMIRKSLVPQEHYLYEDKFGINDDYYTFFKLLQYGRFYNLPEPLLKYRMHGSNSSLQKPKAKFMNSLKIRFIAIKKFKYDPDIKSFLLMMAQVATITLIPEKLIVPLYFFIRGIRTPESHGSSLKTSFQSAILNLQNFLVPSRVKQVVSTK